MPVQLGFRVEVEWGWELMGMSVYVICFSKRFERPEIVNSCCCLPGNVVHYGRGCNPFSEAIWHLFGILMCPAPRSFDAAKDLCVRL